MIHHIHNPDPEEVRNAISESVSFKEYRESYFWQFICRNPNKRRTSSDNISTPASERSRSPSIQSSEDYIPEEEDAAAAARSSAEEPPLALALAPVDKKSSIPEEDEGEDAMTNIDRVCRLIHELKKQG